MTQRIGVLGACDTGGLATSLKLLLPGHNVQPLTMPHGSEGEQHDWLTNTRESFDTILLNALQPLPDFWEAETGGIRIVRYPHIEFHAFHPDMTYVSRYVDGQHHLMPWAYNSAICTWAYINGLPAERAIALFNQDVFEALGYFDEWEPSVAVLSARFAACGIDFRRFLLKAKRGGAFMLSANHPKIDAIVALAKCIAIDKLGFPESISSDPVYTADHLASSYWPIYPEIGEFYSIKSIYNFNWNNTPMDLTAYVSFIYTQFAEQNLQRDNTFFGRSRETLDRVLSGYAGI
jgi:hypothetical protein